MTTKIHLVCDGQARTLAFVLTGGQVADTSMFTDVLDEIHVSGRGHARTRPDRVLADKGYPALRILGGGEGVKSAGDQEHAEPVVVVVGEAAGDPAGEFDEPVHGLGAAVG